MESLQEKRNQYKKEHENDLINEEATRKDGFCLGCGGVKGEGCIVCWECFKYREDVEPYKYWGGGFFSWLDHLNTEGK